VRFAPNPRGSLLVALAHDVFLGTKRDYWPDLPALRRTVSPT
jgi:hypothetical protein